MHPISLSPALQSSLEGILASGQYGDDINTFVEEAIKQRIIQIQQTQQEYAEKVAYIRQALQEGYDDIAAGRVVNGEDFFAEMEEWLETHA
jgi:hypothetical protein